MNKDNICFIQAKYWQDDFSFDAKKQMGYAILTPYRDYNLFSRCLREVWVKLSLPIRQIWFNGEIKKSEAEVFIVSDSLVSVDFFKWLRQTHPESRIILEYHNRVGKNFINPNNIPDGIGVEKWSYDPDDCNKFNMHHISSSYYFEIYRLKEKQKPIYDIVYLGRDKGRAQQLFDLENMFNSLGLKTYFHICADRCYQRYKHTYYKSYMPYREYLSLISKTRAILNIMPEGQRSITMRDMECVFNGIKGITNNKGIKDFELYHPSRFFVLGEDNVDDLPKFLNEPFSPIHENILGKYKFETVITKMMDRMERKKLC